MITSVASNAHCKAEHFRASNILELDDEAKAIIEDLGAAINRAIERSSEVANTIERMREAGFEIELTLRLEIGLRQQDAADDTEDKGEASIGREATLELTEEDRRTLQSMKIRIDDFE